MRLEKIIELYFIGEMVDRRLMQYNLEYFENLWKRKYGVNIFSKDIVIKTYSGGTLIDEITYNKNTSERVINKIDYQTDCVHRFFRTRSRNSLGDYKEVRKCYNCGLIKFKKQKNK